MVVNVAVGHRRAVHDRRVVEHRAVAFLRLFELLQEVRQHRHVIAVDLIELENRRLASTMVRRGVEALVRARLRERAARGVATGLEREHARHVRLERQHLNVEHQLHVLFERIGHTGRCFRQQALVAAGILRFDLLDATLELTHVLEVLVHATTVSGAEFALERRHLTDHPVENAAVVLATGRAVGVVRAGAEQQIEGSAGIPDHRQRFSGRGPADRVGVGAGVVVVAAAGLIEILDAQLHRRDRRVLSDLTGHDLVERRAHVQIRTLRLLRV